MLMEILIKLLFKFWEDNIVNIGLSTKVKVQNLNSRLQ